MEKWIQVAAAPIANPATGTAAPSDPMAGIVSLAPFILIFILFIVLFYLPQRKQQKRHEGMIKALKKGDEVITSGGMFGTITGFNERENSVYLKMSENVKIEIQRASVSGLRRSTPVSENKSMNS